MADLNNELNVPAAPSLTFDAAPAAPTLTLDPAADEKVIEESKKATPMQVEDTPLSPEEQKMVNDFAEKIDITNSQMVLQYGAAAQKSVASFSENALNNVRSKETIISTDDSPNKILLIPTNEELMIAMDTASLVG